VPFSTYFGGSLNEIVQGIAVDNNGIAYIAGVTQSSDMPTSNPYASALPGQQSTFIAGFDTVGAKFIYGTYLGGTLVDYCQAIAYSAGSVYVTGYSTSTNFPVTSGAMETTPLGGTEAFVAQLNPALSGSAQLLASTYLPGSADDAPRAIAVDSAGSVYVAGETGSPDFRVTANGVQIESANHAGVVRDVPGRVRLRRDPQHCGGAHWTRRRGGLHDFFRFPYDAERLSDKDVEHRICGRVSDHCGPGREGGLGGGLQHVLQRRFRGDRLQRRAR
jgi:hypothetical protein